MKYLIAPITLFALILFIGNIAIKPLDRQIKVGDCYSIATSVHIEKKKEGYDIQNAYGYKDFSSLWFKVVDIIIVKDTKLYVIQYFDSLFHKTFHKELHVIHPKRLEGMKQIWGRFSDYDAKICNKLDKK